MSNKNREKGHRFERETVSLYRDIGFPHAKTSREASRLYDNCGIDVWGACDLMQCKDVLASINYSDLFDSMDALLLKNFPSNAPEHNMPRVIRHVRRRKKQKTKNEDLIIIPSVYYFDLLRRAYGSEDVREKTAIRKL